MTRLWVVRQKLTESGQNCGPGIEPIIKLEFRSQRGGQKKPGLGCQGTGQGQGDRIRKLWEVKPGSEIQRWGLYIKIRLAMGADRS